MSKKRINLSTVTYKSILAPSDLLTVYAWFEAQEVKLLQANCKTLKGEDVSCSLKGSVCILGRKPLKQLHTRKATTRNWKHHTSQ
jgi:hypothetical protein